MNFKVREKKFKKPEEDRFISLSIKAEGKKYYYSKKLGKKMSVREILNFDRYKNTPFGKLKVVLQIEERRETYSPIINHTRKLLEKGISEEDIIKNTKITFK